MAEIMTLKLKPGNRKPFVLYDVPDIEEIVLLGDEANPSAYVFGPTGVRETLVSATEGN